jgi:hypothetical protein
MPFHADLLNVDDKLTLARKEIKKRQDILTERLKVARRKQTFSTPEVADLDKLAQTVRQQMSDGVQEYPSIIKFASGQINSASTGDTVLITGVSNKVLKIHSITAYKVTGTTQAFRFEIDTGSSFGTTRRISATNTSDKESNEAGYLLTELERLVINVTTAVSSSTIDYTVQYEEYGHA